MLTPQEILQYLKLDEDVAEIELKIIESLKLSAISLLEAETGKIFDETNSLHQLVILKLISHWYNHRDDYNRPYQVAEYPHSITDMINAIKYNNLKEGELF